MKNDLINKLVECFKTETEKYSNELEGVVNFKHQEFFKKNNPEKGYHSVDASIIFKEFTLKLEYKINISMLIPKSTIEMRFMFENGKLPVEFSIYDLFNIMDKKNFKCYTFGFVTDETKMKDVLNYLVDTFKEYREKIEKISVNLDKIHELEKDAEEKIYTLLSEKVFESRNPYYMMHMLDLYYAIDVSRFTSEEFGLYMEGKYKKAISRYNKYIKRLTKYEKRLLEYLKEDGEIIEVVPQNINTLHQAKKIKSKKTEVLPMFLSWLILTPVWCIIYDLVFFVALMIFSKGAIYVAGANPFIMFLPAFITSIINSYFLRKYVYKIFFRKEIKQIMALDEIENTDKVEHLMAKLFQFVIALGLVFSVLLANTNISFYENGFTDRLSFFNIKGTAFSYMDVKCVYKVRNKKDYLGNNVNNPSYIIHLNNNEQIRLYYYMKLEDIENNIIPIFIKNNIQILEINFENEMEN